MELGQRIREARLEAGLSQRQLCGGEITRNMLSLIENGAAKPSMQTLRYLARQLNKPLRYFLEEDAPEQDALNQNIQLLQKAAAALAENRDILASQLLRQMDSREPDLLRRKALLAARLPGADVPGLCRELPSWDEEVLLRARAALESELPERCLTLLQAAEDKNAPGWNLLMGKCHLARKDYAGAAAHLHRAEECFPEKTVPLLELCYRELGDFKMAYEYACKQKTGAI